MRRARRRDRLNTDEADRILQQWAAGRLDGTDAEVRAVLDEANRSAVRAQLWGRTPESRRMVVGTLAVVGSGVLLFIVGLVVDLFLSHP